MGKPVRRKLARGTVPEQLKGKVALMISARMSCHRRMTFQQHSLFMAVGQASSDYRKQKGTQNTEHHAVKEIALHTTKNL